MGLVRGDIVTVVLASEYGKPRPAVLIQSDFFQTKDSIVVAPMTSDLRPGSVLFRKRVRPSPNNGLLVESDIMIDKISAIPRAKVGKRIGHLEATEMIELTAAVTLFLG
jgi:mRNA interferase MazF